MTLEEKIKVDFIAAFKARNTEIAATLRLLQSALHNRVIEKKGKGEESSLSDEEVLDIIRRETKKRKEAAALYRAGNRVDLAEKEEQELGVLQVYLPAQMSEEEVRTALTALFSESGPIDPKDLGKTMGIAMKHLKGKADAAVVGKVVKELLH